MLKKEGTCWVNMGDTYSGNKEGKTDNKVCSYLKENSQGIKKKATITEKCLCQIPSRFAIEMTNGGWILRNEIIWHKPNCMPSSVKDRFTVDFEKLFFFVKSKKYYFEQQFDPYSAESDAECRKTLRFGKFYRVKEPYKENIPYHKNLQEKGQANHSMHEKRINGDREYNFNSKGKNKRTVWTINTKPYKEAHFATYPKQLCVAPIRAGCPEKGIVLDPFFGSGTTALVAQELERNWIGIELNKEYIGIAKDRLKQKPLF